MANCSCIRNHSQSLPIHNIYRILVNPFTFPIYSILSLESFLKMEGYTIL